MHVFLSRQWGIFIRKVLHFQNVHRQKYTALAVKEVLKISLLPIWIVDIPRDKLGGF